MSYHPLDDLPDLPPSLPGHELTWRRWPGSREEPASLDASCTCGDWDFVSTASAGGPVEDPAGYWEGHLTAVQLGGAA